MRQAVKLSPSSTAVVDVLFPLEKLSKGNKGSEKESESPLVQPTFHRGGTAAPTGVTNGILNVRNLTDKVDQLKPDYPPATCSPIDKKLIRPLALVLTRFMQLPEGPVEVEGPPKFVNSVQVEQVPPLAPDLGEAERLFCGEAAAALRKLC